VLSVTPAAWLPRRPDVTKVQLPDMYLRNLDKLQLWDILELGLPRLTRREACPHLLQGAVKGFFENL